METWRLFGKLPQATTREEISSQSINGWNPWRERWLAVDRPPILFPKLQNGGGYWRARVWKVEPTTVVELFATNRHDSYVWFYVPALPDDKDGFVVTTPKYEGFWRAKIDDDDELPWPIADQDWPGRDIFLEALARTEKTAERIAYRGYSRCRLCGCQNGFESLQVEEWEFPAGFRHYVEQHLVKPSSEFIDFIMK